MSEQQEGPQSSTSDGVGTSQVQLRYSRLGFWPVGPRLFQVKAFKELNSKNRQGKLRVNPLSPSNLIRSLPEYSGCRRSVCDMPVAHWHFSTSVTAVKVDTPETRTSGKEVPFPF